MSKAGFVVVLALAVLAGGCGGDPKPAPQKARPTSISQLDSGEMSVVRVAFCDLVPRSAIRAALGTGSTRAQSWHNGDRLTDAGGELGHEFGCAWFGPRGRVARAWVFARPVTPGFARTVIRGAGQEPGCQVASKPGFGDPALVQTCAKKGHPLRVRRAGLFGATWLSCELTGRGKSSDLRRRTDTWCVSVASALNAGRPSS